MTVHLGPLRWPALAAITAFVGVVLVAPDRPDPALRVVRSDEHHTDERGDRRQGGPAQRARGARSSAAAAPPPTRAAVPAPLAFDSP